ncbi:hypothetical protein D8674_020582 [Pyrus ussuriensis x Pyrus communis]|uniref:Myb-like domain-containing protein n=1 Tax=Pyrus ussuriensis x Pyrus communis TaxID=2448454 RepID=A0A5N5HU91_9ROSA|nr:hypothetical protein D8674_020582 [Pyrus ussuriensis x Pyrus communis]
MRRPKRGSSSMCRDKNLKGPQSDIMPTSNIPIRLRILVLDIDADFLTFISGLLKLLKHEVASVDNSESTILAALENGAIHYTVKPVCFSDVKNLWGLVLGVNETTRLDSNNNITNRRASVDGKSSSSTDGSNNSKRKRSSEGGKSTYISTKKHKVEWTSELQDRFLEAINYIGLDKAVPKRILEVMNVEGLTRENVASHLQKYRMFLRKVAAKISVSKLSMERAQLTRRALLYQNILVEGQASTLQQRRSFHENFELLVNQNTAWLLNRLRRGANDHEASSSRCLPRSGSYNTRQNPYVLNGQTHSGKQPLMMNTPNRFQPANYCGIFQSNSAQRNWSITNTSADVAYNFGSNNANGVKIGTNIPNQILFSSSWDTSNGVKNYVCGASSSQLSPMFVEGNNIGQENGNVLALENPLQQQQQQYGGTDPVNASNNSSSHVTGGKGKQVMNSEQDTSDDFDSITLDELNSEPATCDKQESQADMMDLEFDGDGLNFVDLSPDEDWEKIMQSLLK